MLGWVSRVPPVQSIFAALRGACLLARGLQLGARMPCIHCGLPTNGEENHGTIEACIEALIAETMRLRKALSEKPKGEIGVTTGPGHPLGKSHFAGS
jgi:hypothetical protein